MVEIYRYPALASIKPERRGGMQFQQRIMIDRFGGKIGMPYLFFLRRVEGRQRKQNRRLGESLNTANEAVIHRELFLTQTPPCGGDKQAWHQR